MDSIFKLDLRNQWPGFGISDEHLMKMAKQLGGDHPHFPDGATMNFRSAKKLLIFTGYEFFLLPYVFLQTVIGLEKVLRYYFHNEQKSLSLKDLLLKAVADDLIPDVSFSDVTSDLKLDKHHHRFVPSDKLTDLIPDLRNKIAHGDYCLTADFLPLALKVRAFADTVANQLPDQ